MDESTILSKFDSFVESGVVLYDDQQQIVEHVDGKLRVSIIDFLLFQVDSIPSIRMYILQPISVPLSLV